MKTIVCAILLSSLSAFADQWCRVDYVGGKVVNFSFCEKPGKHVLVDNEFAIDAVLPKDVPIRYWKKKGQTFVEMSQSEKDAVDESDKQVKAKIENIKDEVVRALAKVIAEELQMTEAQLEAKLKAKLK